MVKIEWKSERCSTCFNSVSNRFRPIVKAGLLPKQEQLDCPFLDLQLITIAMIPRRLPEGSRIIKMSCGPGPMKRIKQFLARKDVVSRIFVRWRETHQESGGDDLSQESKFAARMCPRSVHRILLRTQPIPGEVMIPSGPSRVVLVDILVDLQGIEKRATCRPRAMNQRKWRCMGGRPDII